MGRSRGCPAHLRPSSPVGTYYPSIKPELVELIDALHGIAHEAERRTEYLADRAAYAERFRLTPNQRAALVALDHKAIVAMGTHPLLPLQYSGMRSPATPDGPPAPQAGTETGATLAKARPADCSSSRPVRKPI